MDTRNRGPPGGAVPDALILPSGTLRLYYCKGGVTRADSTDGLAFNPYGQSLLNGGCDPTVVRLTNGTCRMYYKVADGQGGPDEGHHGIHTTWSSDGASFAPQGQVIGQRSDGHWVSVPDAIVLPDGRIRVYYVSNDHVKSSLSTDATGTSFSEEPGARLEDAVDPDITKVGNVWVLTYAGPALRVRPPGEKQYLLYAVSGDAYNFTRVEEIVRNSTYNLMDPTLVPLSDGRARIYYWSAEKNPNEVWSVVNQGSFAPSVPSQTSATSSSTTTSQTTSAGQSSAPESPSESSKKSTPSSPLLPLLLVVGLLAWSRRKTGF